MFVRKFLIIFLFSVAIDLILAANDKNIDCDSIFEEAEESYLAEFVKKHDLQNDFEARNQNYESCLHFLGKLSTLINEYKEQEEENKPQDEFKFIKRTLKKKPRLNSFHFKY